MENLKRFRCYALTNRDLLESQISEVYRSSFNPKNNSNHYYLEISGNDSWTGLIEHASQSITSMKGSTYYFYHTQCNYIDDVMSIAQDEFNNKNKQYPRNWDTLDYEEKEQFYRNENCWHEAIEEYINYCVDEKDYSEEYDKCMSELNISIKDYEVDKEWFGV